MKRFLINIILAIVIVAALYNFLISLIPTNIWELINANAENTYFVWGVIALFTLLICALLGIIECFIFREPVRGFDICYILGLGCLAVLVFLTTLSIRYNNSTKLDTDMRSLTNAISKNSYNELREDIKSLTLYGKPQNAVADEDTMKGNRIYN